VKGITGYGRVVELFTYADPDPALDVALSHALLERAARGGLESVRLWRPRGPALSLGRLDARDPRSEQAAALAQAAGVTTVRRLAGGRAAAFDSGCLCMGWAQADPALEQSSARYRVLADLIIVSLRELGVPAQLGERPGEWCPGAWSVQGPSGKLAGLAQRVIRGGAWSEALIVVERRPELLALSERVHRALDLPWRDDAQGSLAVTGSDAGSQLRDALVAALRRRWPELDQCEPSERLLARARALAPEHRWP
jgi:octanoyl-[GcvH]:protein N-octanoyltransferase